ncbi:translation initiation factor IF-2 [Aequitasia blattaphilus]|uniref:Translation initiation factor IF-2 n=1 Tax=Aequitasia blattaphilus TaxID=2949332 RepID=A0ABT1E5Q6_9FIRM|nr:translation initiation factor IF-2 [Aequitasia blattaphilus]MCP1101173.1 translation initiation factor IF-2 [Aequitasia blattaphilus]MCR8613813.1 translation initiation factor IF-2 [Aequitasia blattaphilus]
MSKKKIYEIAKELDVQSKEVLEYLEKKNIEVKSHMSSVEEDVEKMVRSNFSKEKKTAESVEATDSAEPAKKKNIVHVFRPQNTQSGGSRSNNQRTGQGQQQRPQGQGNQRQRPQGQNSNYQGNRPQGQNSNYQGNRPQGQNSNYQGNRPQGQNSNYQGNRPQGQNSNYQGNRPQGQNSNYQGNRPQGGGQRPQNSNYQGNRPQGGGQRPQNSNYQGNRPQGGGQRPYNQGNQGGDNRGKFQKPNEGTPVTSTETKKPQRNKVKSKEDYKKKEMERQNQAGKGKKGKVENAPQLQKPKAKEQKPEETIKSITIPEVLTIKELADKMKIVPSVIVKKLFLQGKVVTVNQEISFETAEEIALEFEVLCEKEEVIDVIEELLKEEDEDETKLVKRPPVVCVMGHVDHGKTSLLDAIRHTNVIDREAGGITQHIGAYVVKVNGEKITFLDTPGHEAFTAMRMRGASSTDIAILVVAADDGVMPQTVEAINHAKAAEIEIVVAVNKIDKPGANIDRVKQELAEYELIPEDWGGSTIFVPVSAKSGEGIEELMEMLLLTSEVLELKANPDRNARGLVIEAELDKGKGSVATVLVQKGTLHVGDNIAAGSAYGKVRAMMDDRGRRVKEAGPSVPVEILGLNDVPNAGEVFVSTDNDKEARHFAETFISQGKERLLDDTKTKVSLDDLFEQIKEGNLKELGIVVKADVQGSVEAIKQSLLKLSNDEVVVKIIHGGVGAINESDVILASASNAIIIGFNVRPDASAKETADREGVDVRLYRVIYNAIEDVEAAMKGMLDPVFEEKVLGHAEVRQTFKASGIGTIAGSYVQDGTFERGCQVRITRDGVVVFEGNLASLKRFKDDVKEVRAGYECGLVFENYNDIKEGDLVESFKMVEIPR